MAWFSKVKNWFTGLFKKEKIEQVVEQPVVEVLPSVIETLVEVPKQEESELSKRARETKALGPADLVKPAKKECEHALMFNKQTWVRISDKKFELHNELNCTKCHDRKVVPIR